MKLWFATNQPLSNIPISLRSWLQRSADIIFYSSDIRENLTEWKRWVPVRKKSFYKGLMIGQPFLRSQLLAEEIIEMCKHEGHPDVFVIYHTDSYSYYLLQNIRLLHPVIKGIPVILLVPRSCLTDASNPDYRLPQYWVGRTEKFCLAAADYVVAMDDTVYQLVVRMRDHFNTALYQEESNDELLNSTINRVLFHHNQKHLYPEINQEPKREKRKRVDFKRKKLSVIIPFYNLGIYLKDAVDSVRANEYSNYEIIIVNDGSDDPESVRILNMYRSGYEHIRVIDTPHRGLANARNVGAYAANGEYIAFLDADDQIECNYYEWAIRVLEHYPNISFVYSWVQYIDKRDDIWVTFNTEFPLLLLTNMLAAFPVIRKSEFINFGLNKVEMKSGMEDYESWISMCEAGCIGVALPAPLVRYRIRSDSMSRNFNREMVVSLYNHICRLHPELFKKYGDEVVQLINSNGPGYMWNNPTVSYPALCYGSMGNSVKVSESENDLKYELLRIMNSKLGRLLIKVLFKTKLNKVFK